MKKHLDIYFCKSCGCYFIPVPLIKKAQCMVCASAKIEYELTLELTLDDNNAETERNDFQGKGSSGSKKPRKRGAKDFFQ